MKKRTLISLAIMIIGIVLPLIGATLGPPILGVIGNFLIYLGFFLTYIFVISWQAEISKTRLNIALSISAFLFLSFIVYFNIKGSEAEQNLKLAYELEGEALEQVRSAQIKQAKIVIDSLSKELENCK